VEYTREVSDAQVDIIVPVGLHDDDPDLQALIESIIALHKRTGFSQFILSAPSKGWRSVGYPPRDHFDRIAADLLVCRTALGEHGIRVGWWHSLTLKTGPLDSQRIVNINGDVAPRSACPLDAKFQQRFAEDVALVAKKANPYLIFFEDDYGLNCHNGYACFCDLHLEAFATRTGRRCTREQLRTVLLGDDAAATTLRLAWAEVHRDSLVAMAARVRRAVDRETPWIPIGSMQPGCADRDGDTTEAVARALAGSRHRPFVRLYGTSYSNDDPSTLPQNIFHALYSKEHLPGDFIIYHESDTYPHNRFFMSAGKMRGLMVAAYSYGFDGSTFQVRQHLDEGNEECGYADMFTAERRRFDGLKRAAKQCAPHGCGLIFDPLAFCKHADENHWVRAFAHFGIPYVTRESHVNALSGAQPNGLSDTGIQSLLRRGLILDGEAALALCRRGFGNDLGVTVETLDPAQHWEGDIQGNERIRDAFIHDRESGSLMAWYSAYSPYGRGDMYRLTPVSNACEIVTDLLSFQGQNVGVGMTRFVNRHGGRILVMAMGVKNNHSHSLFNYRRQKLMHSLIAWAGADDLVYVKDRPKVFCIQNRPLATADVNLLGMVTLTSLCPDPFDSVDLHLPTAWKPDLCIRFLDQDGDWREARYECREDEVRILHSLVLYMPMCLRFDSSTRSPSEPSAQPPETSEPSMQNGEGERD